MTNAELIRAIRNEIERLMDEYNPVVGGVDETTGAHIALAKLILFLSTLESEKPVPNDLEEAAVDIADVLLAKPKDYVLSAKADYWNGAHDGIIAGAKWQAEHTPLHEDTVLFNKGVEEGKRLMMEEAVDVQVVGEQRDLRLIDSTERCLFNANRGDWLKIIIVKE